MKRLTKQRFNAALLLLGACSDARRWVDRKNLPPLEAILACANRGWLLWLLYRMLDSGAITYAVIHECGEFAHELQTDFYASGAVADALSLQFVKATILDNWKAFEAELTRWGD